MSKDDNSFVIATNQKKLIESIKQGEFEKFKQKFENVPANISSEVLNQTFFYEEETRKISVPICLLSLARKFQRKDIENYLIEKGANAPQVSEEKAVFLPKTKPESKLNFYEVMHYRPAEEAAAVRIGIMLPFVGAGFGLAMWYCMKEENMDFFFGENTFLVAGLGFFVGVAIGLTVGAPLQYLMEYNRRKKPENRLNESIEFFKANAETIKTKGKISEPTHNLHRYKDAEYIIDLGYTEYSREVQEYHGKDSSHDYRIDFETFSKNHFDLVKAKYEELCRADRYGKITYRAGFIFGAVLIGSVMALAIKTEMFSHIEALSEDLINLSDGQKSLILFSAVAVGLVGLMVIGFSSYLAMESKYIEHGNHNMKTTVTTIPKYKWSNNNVCTPAYDIKVETCASFAEIVNAVNGQQV